jgi:hypothetical protein
MSKRYGFIYVDKDDHGNDTLERSKTLAMAIGPVLCIRVIRDLSYHVLFLIASGLSAATLLLTFGAKMSIGQKSEVRKIEFFDKSVLPVTISVFLLFIAYGGINTFVPLFLYFLCDLTI